MTKLQNIEQDALREIANIKNMEALESWRVAYLGRKGEMTTILRKIRDLPVNDRPQAGQNANETKEKLEQAYSEKKLNIENAIPNRDDLQAIDVTLPGRAIRRGSLHPITLTRRALEQTFSEMGFDIAEGPDVEWDTYNFDRLRIPLDHPARDMWDTIWIDPSQFQGEQSIDGKAMLMRTHTSPMQIRYMESHFPPIRVIVPGTCYRYEATDATHEWMLTQIEGLVIGEGITFAHLKGTLESFVYRFFGPGIESRFRCDYFPFVEPGAELAIKWKNRWLEMLGAGMVHPEVIEQAGFDPERYTGFAFGMGVERFAMLKYGIDDIRYFYQNDTRFLEQFSS